MADKLELEKKDTSTKPQFQRIETLRPLKLNAIDREAPLWREILIKAAERYIDQSNATVPEQEKFLEQKGLKEDEIQEAIRRYNIEDDTEIAETRINRQDENNDR